MSTKLLLQLIEKFKSATIGDDEREELLTLLSENRDEPVVTAFLADLWETTTTVVPVFDQSTSAKLLNDIIEDSDKELPTARKISVLYKWSTIAAAAIVILLCGYFFIGRDQVRAKQNIVRKLIKQPDIAPGGARAMLVLGDSTRIYLDSAGNGTLARMGGVSVTKTKTGEINYIFSGSGTSGESPVYNTISTPRGGEYSVVLPDGSKVWLNASSSLRFPSFFNGKDRHVELTGEGYFEVAKQNGKPFYVKAGASEVEVLGTHFNINAYPDEEYNSTTLLEGSVRVNLNGNSRTLMPGQQAKSVNGKNGIQVVEADTESITAWKNGYFIFADENIHSIMRKLARWYNVEIEFQDPFINETFAGTASRQKNISEVLEVLETTGTVHFKIIPGKSAGAGRRVLVMD